jgi:alpha-ketoglutarate-dependent taurine dioxygenase
MDDKLQKELVQRLGELSKKPKTSGVHIHPFFNAGLPLGGDDNEIDVVSTEQNRIVFEHPRKFVRRQTARQEWHTDIPHEPVPSDYGILRLTDLPKGGGGGIVSDFFCLYYSALTHYRPRYSLGFWIRALRSHLRTVSKVPGGSDCHLRKTEI